MRKSSTQIYTTFIIAPSSPSYVGGFGLEEINGYSIINKDLKHEYFWHQTRFLATEFACSNLTLTHKPFSPLQISQNYFIVDAFPVLLTFMQELGSFVRIGQANGWKLERICGNIVSNDANLFEIFAIMELNINLAEIKFEHICICCNEGRTPPYAT